MCLTDDTVSRNHAVIRRTKEGVVLQDLGSTNGTFVGPVRIREVFLSENKTFRVGLTTLAFDPKDEIVNVVPLKEAHFEGMVGKSVAMREVFSILNRVATTDLTVLVLGETGTGKELVSAAVHARSKRKDNPFVVFDCGAVQPNLIESELFGHERGAFTGAVAPELGSSSKPTRARSLSMNWVSYPLASNPRSCAFWSNAKCVAWAGAA